MALKILHIENNQEVRNAIARCLRLNLGADVIGVASGEDALEVLRENEDVAFILSDWNIDGFIKVPQMFDWIRENRPKLIDKIVILTASDDVEAACTSAGIPVLVKPARNSVIVGTITKVLRAS